MQNYTEITYIMYLYPLEQISQQKFRGQVQASHLLKILVLR